MASATVYEGVADGADVRGTLFEGKKFFLTQRLPQRSRFVDLVKSNGGTVVILEKKADYVIADHFRRDCPPGSISYTFIEQSVKDGELADPEQHLAGPATGTLRAAGSTMPAKGTRTPYTPEDDRLLYKWVKDHERGGTGLANGNEIYKQLEKKCPRHTWQSWRDRYVKRLRDNPPSGLSVPDNAPPSPSSPESPEQSPQMPAPKQEKKAPNSVSKQPSGKSSEGSSTSGHRKLEPNSVEELRELFDQEAYEELYANVEVIRDTTVKDYIQGWRGFAEGTLRTAEQWRLFFERVVQPEWERDSTPKKRAVKKRVRQRHAEAAEQDDGEEPEPSTPTYASAKANLDQSPIGHSGDDAFDSYLEKFLRERQGRRVQEAYLFWAREAPSDGTRSLWEEYSHLETDQLHAQLLSIWHDLRDAEKAPYVIMEKADRRRAEIERQAPSSSAVQETPDYIAETHQNIMKRIREGNVDEHPRSNKSSPSKKRKLEEASPSKSTKQQDLSGAQAKPIEISSAAETTSSLDEDSQEKRQREDNILQDELRAEDDEGDAGNEPTPTAARPNVRYPDLPPDSSASPRPDQHGAHSDTQAARELTPELPVSSPIGLPESEASVSESLQEFRASLLDTRDDSERPDTQLVSRDDFEDPDTQMATRDESVNGDTQGPPREPTMHREPSISSQVSDASSDPDPPLEPQEFPEFFAEQREQGFSDLWIKAALEHTLCRPVLAVEVLDAWRDGKALPRKRGVWSERDDRDAESGDGLALAKLERLHTDKGWGGIEERLEYLEAYRRKMGAQGRR